MISYSMVIEGGIYVLQFNNEHQSHEWTFYNEYEVENMAVFDTLPRGQKTVKVSFTLKPKQNTLLVFRQLNGKAEG
jgi:hypothetical protein